MAGASRFSLNSTSTAIALVLPPSKSADVQGLRSVHDKAYHKWPPHINLIYPSVTAEQLPDALPLFRNAMSALQTPFLSGHMDRVGRFEHRKNATVFLQPSDDYASAISQIRKHLVQAIGLSDRAGTRDGVFRPHMTIGQAVLSKSGEAIENLIAKVEPTTGLSWENASLAVLKRKPTGEMEVIDEIAFGKSETTAEPGRSESAVTPTNTVWTPCFSFTVTGWIPSTTDHTEPTDRTSGSQTLSILSYNLLADTFGCPFQERLPYIIEALKSMASTSPQVVCFQEVSVTMLNMILDDPYVRHKYPFSSHHPESVLVNYLNLVNFSTAPFEFLFHHFSDRHKSALVIRPRPVPVEIANVHLTAALKDDQVAAKERQMNSLTAFFDESCKSSMRVPIIAGDFNLPTSAATIARALERKDISFTTSVRVPSIIDPDIWNDSYLLSRDETMVEGCEEGEDGATFDVQRNPWAAESNAPADQRPQRYDRILFQQPERVQITDFMRFGFPNAGGKCGSDHFGIAAALEVSPIRQQGSKRTANSTTLGSIALVEDDTDLAPLLTPYLPTEADRAARTQALSQLSKLLKADTRLAHTAIAPLGSYALDTYFPSSDIDVLVIGSLPPSAFFSIASARLKSSSSTNAAVHYINSLVPVIETTIKGIKFDVQYCQAPSIITTLGTSETTLEELVFDQGVLEDLQPASLRPLNTYRDTAYLLRSIPCLDAFRIAHRIISLYLRARGLYSAKFGYLGGIHLSLLLNHLIKHLDPAAVASISAASVIRTFFAYYSSFPWSTEMVYDPEHPHRGCRRTPREAVVILSLHSPTARPNVASSCTRLSAQTISHEFALAADKLATRHWQWLLRSSSDGLTDLSSNYPAFILLTLDIWSIPTFGGPSTVRDILGASESRIPRLMVQLGRVSDAIRAQAWPYRLSNPSEEVEEGQQLKVHYIIGLDVSSASSDKQARSLLRSKIQQAVDEYVRMVTACREYDSQFCLLQTELMSQKKISALQLENVPES